MICSPVAGLRPKRALSLRLRNTPSPTRRSRPSFLNCLTTNSLSIVELDLGDDTDPVGQMGRHLSLYHPPPPKAQQILSKMNDWSAKFKIVSAWSRSIGVDRGSLSRASQKSALDARK